MSLCWLVQASLYWLVQASLRRLARVCPDGRNDL